MNDFFENYVINNWRLKVYALLVSLVLWSMILGQRSLIVKREVPIEFVLSPETSVEKADKFITITISAKRSVIQRFNPTTAAPEVDLRGLPEGPKRIPIRAQSISMPLGAKVLAIEPKTVSLYLRKNKNLVQPKSYRDSVEQKEIIQ
jgi:hypothetical protein